MLSKEKTKKTSTFVSIRKPFMINAIYVEIDLTTKQALKIERINEAM